jgi:parallel beta-helix repeat protein
MAKINFPYNLQNGKKSNAEHVMANLNVLKDRLNSGLQADNLEEDSVTDDIIGNRTVNQDIADTSANTGKLTQLLSWIVKEIRAIKGTDDWKDSASSTLAAVYSALTQKVDKEAGKQLSTEDYTTEEKAKLAGLSNYEHPATHPATMITEDSTHRFATDNEKAAWNGAVSDSHVHSNKTVLDKFTEQEGELRYNAKPIKSDVTLEDVTSLLNAGLATKVDAVEGKGLSTEDFTTEEKTKLAGLFNYEHPATHSADIIVDGTTNKVFTAVEKTKLAGLFNYEHPATHSADIIVDGTTNKVFTAVEKTKLAGLSNYEHPATHPATMITEDTEHRFVTDAEKAAWSGKQDDLGFTPEDSANKGKANGYASLDSTGKIPSTQLPEIPEAGIKSINSIENAGGDIAIVGSTGITVTTDDENKRIVVTATGDMTPGAHAASHGIGGSDPISPASIGAVAAVEGKGLSTEDFTTEEKTKLAGLSNYEHPATHPATMITEDSTHRFMTDAERTKLSGLSNYEHPATHSADIIVDGTTNKVFTAVEKTKLAGLSNYEHPATHPATMITEDSTHRFMTDAERTKLSGLSNYEHPATHSADIIVDGTTNKVFTAVEKTKLAGLSNYEHPATHPATMITEDSTHRFATDSEKSSWDSAAAASHSHTNSAVLAKFSEEDGTLCYDGEAMEDIARTARFVIGTSTAGWTAADCDYLCDGTADDVEINAAITALPATGGEIVILDGTYNIAAKIDVTKDNVSIRGNGNATILKRMFDSSVKEGVITLTGRSGCKIADLQVDGNKTSYTSSNNYGIYLDSSSNNTIIGNTCNNNNSYGIYLSSASNNTVTSNTCNNNNYGIYLRNSSNNSTVTSNTCNNNSYGICLNKSSNNTVTGNVCDNNYIGIYFYDSSNNTVTSNTCNNNNFGIGLGNSNNNNTIIGNTCNNNGSYGIYLDTSSNNTVTCNTCNNNKYGIDLDSSSNNNTVTSNTCNNNNAGIRLSSSSNNTVASNTCIRGTGLATDYTESQHTIWLKGTSNNYNLISNNNCMGKAVTNGGGTGNSVWGNKFDETDDTLNADQIRKITLSTENPSGGSDGDIWIKYKA